MVSMADIQFIKPVFDPFEPFAKQVTAFQCLSPAPGTSLKTVFRIQELVNGADTNDFALNTIAIQPNLDAIEQFNLLEGPLNAEYDRNYGGSARVASRTIATLSYVGSWVAHNCG